MNSSFLKAFAGSAIACLLAACASVPPPTEQMAVSRARLEDAQAAGAPTLASVSFNDAQRKLDAARAAMSAGDNRDARRLAEEAEVDAQLAAERARAAKADRAYAEVERSIEALRDELARRP
jgi:Domain of unknown function (DUF4398)